MVVGGETCYCIESIKACTEEGYSIFGRRIRGYGFLLIIEKRYTQGRIVRNFFWHSYNIYLI